MLLFFKYRRERPFGLDVRRLFNVAALTLCAALLALAAPARAEEPWLLHLDASLVIPAGQPQRDLFGPGLGGAASVERALIPSLAVGLRLRALVLFDGPPPAQGGLADPGIGTLTTLSAVVRWNILTRSDQPARALGPWIDLAGGAGYTGSALRGSFEVGLGYGFALGELGLGPVLRYVHVVQPNSGGLDDRDAHLVLLGARLSLLDARREPPPPPPPRPGDRDYDRILDPDDACPDEPEDYDGFEDTDGCPDRDNDQDGILDADDACPDEAEDVDGFEDEDGCPDPDNDQDGFLDPDDECPDEAEVINGVDDDDGCPDEGLIEMVDDRIILEERVLFDFERARIKHAATPVIAAIVNLVAQHPEWLRLRVEGHADVRGDEAYNQRLSERRARNVMHALIQHGVPADKITSVGFGSTRPRDLHRTELAHQRNRRVEFVVLERRPANPAEARAARRAQAGVRAEEPETPSNASGDSGTVPADGVESASSPVDADDAPEAPADGAEPGDGGNPPADAVEGASPAPGAAVIHQPAPPSRAQAPRADMEERS